eukprot:78754-Amphidinium_carterae.1
MQTVDAESLALKSFEATPEMLALGWGLTVDGIELVEDPQEIMRKGEYAAVPLLLGYNKDEANFFTFQSLPDPINATEGLDYLVSMHQGDAS